MRSLAALSLVLLAACPPTGGGGSDGDDCFVDEECATGEVCARDDLCWPAADVRPVETTWTVRGQPASETTCARYPELYIEFDGSVRDELGFSPVPCAIGRFTVDKLPRAFTRVELGAEGGPWKATTISLSGDAQIDLAF